MANFSHRHVYSASLHHPMSIRTIDPVCPRAILPMRVTLFPSGMLRVINIPSINGNDTLFGSQLNGEHAGESFISPRFIVFRYANVRMKNCRFCKKLTFDLSQLGQILTHDKKKRTTNRKYSPGAIVDFSTKLYDD